MDSRVKRDGKAIEELGFYNPLTNETHLKFPTNYLRLKEGRNQQIQFVTFL